MPTYIGLLAILHCQINAQSFAAFIIQRRLIFSTDPVPFCMFMEQIVDTPNKEAETLNSKRDLQSQFSYIDKENTGDTSSWNGT